MEDILSLQSGGAASHSACQNVIMHNTAVIQCKGRTQQFSLYLHKGYDATVSLKKKARVLLRHTAVHLKSISHTHTHTPSFTDNCASLFKAPGFCDFSRSTHHLTSIDGPFHRFVQITSKFFTFNCVKMQLNS